MGELKIVLTRQKYNINDTYCHNPSLTKETDLWLSTGLGARYFWILLKAQADSHWHLICLTLTFPISKIWVSYYCCNSTATRQEFKLGGWIQGQNEGSEGLTSREKSCSGSWVLNQGPKPKPVPRAKEELLGFGSRRLNFGYISSVTESGQDLCAWVTELRNLTKTLKCWL